MCVCVCACVSVRFCIRMCMYVCVCVDCALRFLERSYAFRHNLQEARVSVHERECIFMFLYVFFCACAESYGDIRCVV